MSTSSRTRSVMTSFIARQSTAGPSAPRSSDTGLSLERANALLGGAKDAVDLDENGRLGRVLRVRSGTGRGSGAAAHSGQREGPILVADRTEPVAEASVGCERCRPRALASVSPSTARPRRTAPAGPRGTPRRGAADAGSARSHGCAATATRLALGLLGRPEREVEDLERMPGPKRQEAGASASWLPASISTLGWARWTTFWCAWKIVRLSPGCAGAARRRVMRSAKNGPSSGRGRKCRQQPRTTP